MAGSHVPTGAVCTAGIDPFLTAWALEAHGTEAGGGARLVHTGAPIEARGRGTVVSAGLAVGPGVAWRAGARVASRVEAAGATVETGPRVTSCYLLTTGGPCIAYGAGAVVARRLGMAGRSMGTGRGDTTPQFRLTLWSCPTHVTYT